MRLETNKIPKVHVLTEDDAESYWQKLGDAKLRYEYRGHEMQYGHPVQVPLEVAAEVAAGAEELWNSVETGIKEKGGLTQWMEGHAPHIGDAHLNNPAINAQLEERLAAGYKPSIAYDVILTVSHGRPRYRVVEAQTAIAYSAMHITQLEAAGYDPRSPETYYGNENPIDVMDNMRHELAGGEEVIVMDTDPYGGSIVDIVGMAKMLGDETSLPASPLDLRKDDDGYYYHKAILDDQTNFPARDEAGAILREEAKTRVNHVLTRMTQGDLDELDHLLGDNEEQRQLVLEFLNDENVNFLWHPTWHYIVDKSVLPGAWKDAVANDAPHKDHFVPIYMAGEQVPPGRYVRKPVDGVSGGGQSKVTVAEDSATVVDKGHVMQEEFIPYPVPVELPEALGQAFETPSDIPPFLAELYGWNGQTKPATVELRFMPTPYCKDEFSGWMLSRVAPRWANPSEGRERTKTNQGTIQDSLYRSPTITNENFKLFPHGWCPVVIS